MRIAVIDDERMIRKDLIYYLKALAPDAEIEEADSGYSAVELANAKSFDVFFLDINLGDTKGTVLALMLQKTAPQASVIFVTAYGEYGPQAFELNAADYIMKPFNKERVEKALKKALQQRRINCLDNEEEIRGGAADQDDGEIGRIAIHHDRRVTLLEPEDIVYVESTQRNCLVSCKEGRQYLTSTTLTELGNRLAGKNFMRVHKSFIINLDCVSEISMLYAKSYCVKMKGYEKTPLPVGRSQIRRLKEIFQS